MSGRSEVNVFSESRTVRFHRGIEAHRVVKTSLDVTGAAGSRAVVLSDLNADRLHAALEVGSHRHRKQAEKEFVSGSDTDLGTRTDHHRTDIERSTRAEGRNPGGVRLHRFIESLQEGLLRKRRHFETAAGVLHAFRVLIRTESHNVTVFRRVSLQAFETGLGIVENAGCLRERDIGICGQTTLFPRAVMPAGLPAVIDRTISEPEVGPIKIFLFHFAYNLQKLSC